MTCIFFYVFQIIWDLTEKSIISRRRGLKNLMNRQTTRDWMNWGDLQTKGANVKVGIITIPHRGWCKTRVEVIEEMDVGALEDENHKIRQMTQELIHRIILKALLNGNFFHVVFSGRLCCIFMRRWRWMYIGGTPKESKVGDTLWVTWWNGYLVNLINNKFTWLKVNWVDNQDTEK